MTELTVPELDRPRVVAGSAYLFEGPRGPVSPSELFDGKPRPAVHDPGVRLVLVSGAPYAKFERYRRHFGRGLPAHSAAGSAFAEAGSISSATSPVSPCTPDRSRRPGWTS
ncbi:hypothetical protein ACFVYA_28020 [Amycolatopsis sp. NPDC058278]|uniref:hypothetical protein n=1 Tax=Amycolatopsis sp. NPDC058278 TaxID=3346417 RepID=UPI0036DD3611